MDFRKELEIMRENYRRKPLKIKKLPRPRWLTEEDGLSSLYIEKDRLFEQGQVYYACLVQANNRLFNPALPGDYPAFILYSPEACTEENPLGLADTAHYIFSLKDKEEGEIPPELRELAGAVKDELDRSFFSFNLRPDDRTSIEMKLVTIMVFRSFLPNKASVLSLSPQRALFGRILPIIAAPGVCKSAIVLPEKYWSKDFKREWLQSKFK